MIETKTPAQLVDQYIEAFTAFLSGDSERRRHCADLRREIADQVGDSTWLLHCVEEKVKGVLRAERSLRQEGLNKWAVNAWSAARSKAVWSLEANRDLLVIQLEGRN